MGLSISAVGKGTPGVNGVPGDTFTNKELLTKLTEELPFFQKAGLFISPSHLKKAERAIEAIEKKTWIKERQIFISDTLFPNECLATAASLDAIKNMEKVNPRFNLTDIHGFILISDTNDTVFPVAGKTVVKALGIKPKHFANSSLACASIVNAIQQACAWMEYDESCKYVLIAAVDITTRLHQRKAQKQPFLFGDGAVAMVLEKHDGLGGFIVSNLHLDPDAPDVVHLLLHTRDSPEIQKAFYDLDFNNDENLKRFGDYEVKTTAMLYRIFFDSPEGKSALESVYKRNSSENNGTPPENNEVFIPPQAPMHILFRAAMEAEINCKDYENHTIENTVVHHAITGAAGTPLALYYLSKRFPLSKTRVNIATSAIGGLNAILTYDPKAKKILSYGYNIEQNNAPALNEQKNLTPINGNGKALPRDFTIDDIVSRIHSTLKIKAD